MEILRDIFSVMLYVVITGCGIVVVKMILGECRAYVVAHNLRTEGLGHVDAVEEVLDHRVNIVCKKICTYGIGYNLETYLFAVRSDLLGGGETIGSDTELALIEIDKLYTVEADLLCKIAYLEIVALLTQNVFSEAIA